MLGSLIMIYASLTTVMVPPQPAPLSSVPELHPIDARVIEKTNAQRVRHGLRPLVVDRRLLMSARRHAAWMTNSRSMTHTTQPVGENIAMGQNSSTEVMNSWMNSSGHRANILNPGYTRIGVAAYTAPGGTIYWCQQFLR
ncbi:MAG TPA: CAP domain-containing protein [Pirellulales bacterium]|jgi:uncharacterized protein YkwD|nr:CAP domain-containing protein [Pirellulales bacterium]